MKKLKKLAINPEQFIVMRTTDISEDYDILEEIGCGTFGCSYISKEKRSNEKRAIKKIRKDSLDET